ncbi:MAG TPA: flagellar biosynthetic protein FliO [Planctomycetota bacterium]|nr:flagellar biosynthetic protein FliO [Planctomycetota bacterium]
MPTAREIDARFDWSALMRRPVLKPLVMSAVCGALLLAALAAASAFSPKGAESDGARRAVDSDGAVDAGSTSPGLLDAAPDAKAKADRTSAEASKPRRNAVAAAAAGGDGPSAARVYVVLGGVCAVAVGLAWLLRDKLRNGRTAPAKEKLLVVRDQLALDAKRRVVVLSVEERTLVVGVVGDTLTLLTEYGAAEEVAPAAESSFAAVASTMVAPPEPAAPPSPEPAVDVAAADVFDAPRISAAARRREAEERAATRFEAAAPAPHRTFPFAKVEPARGATAATSAPTGGAAMRDPRRVPERFRHLLGAAAEGGA